MDEKRCVEELMRVCGSCEGGRSGLAEDIEKIYAKYPDAEAFKDIEDPVEWQKRLRDEWE